MQHTNDTPYDHLYPSSFTAEDFTREETYRYTRAPVEAALTLIPEAYTSPEFYALEQARVFSNSWVVVGCTSQVKGPQDVLVADVAGQSIIVTRNKAGELRAFYNVCRHRGAKMLDDDCTRLRSSRVRCPYHSWAYDLDGHCIGTPLFEGSDIPEDQQGIFDMGGVEKFDRADYGLFPVKVDSWGFLIFVNLNDKAAPLAEQLGDLPERFANYDLEAWQAVREKEFIFNANYKLVGENFMEYYHLPWVHPELIKVSRMEDHYRWQGPGMYTGMTTWPISQSSEDGGWLGLPPLRSLTDTNRESARFIWLFPNVALSIMPNHAFVMLTQPDGPTRTVEQTWLLSHPESLDNDGAETELDQLIRFWTLVNEQDIDIVEKVQAGLAMKPYRGGRMCYRFEEPLHRYQNMIIDKMVGQERIPPGDVTDQTPMFGNNLRPASKGGNALK
jgi:choline monooxygenase